MILLLEKAGIIVFAGLAATFFAMQLVRVMAAKARVKEAGVESAPLPAEATKAPRQSYFQHAILTLAENPDSKESGKIKLYAAAGVFALALLLAGKIIFALLCAGGAFFSVGWHYKKQLKKKMDIFENQLIEGLAMIKNSVRAGQSLTQAIENMVKDTKPPLSAEFDDVLRKTRLGTSMEQALSDMSARIKSKDLKIAVTSINLAKETGGNMGEILTRLSDTMRERRKIQGKIVALTAQGKASGMVMSGVPFLLLAVLYFMEPGMMGLLFTTLLGNVMLAIAVTMVSLGSFLIGKIVNIDI